MKYSTRILLAAVFSVLLNLAIWEAAARIVSASPVPKEAPEVSPPLVFTLSDPVFPEVPEQDIPQQLIETVRESTEPIEDTDLISDKNSKASDINDSEGERPAPAMDEESEFDQQGQLPSEDSTALEAVPEQKPSEESPLETAEAVEEIVEPEDSGDDKPIMEDEQAVILAGEFAEEQVEEESEEEPVEEQVELVEDKPEQEELPERFEVAQAEKPKMQFQEDMEVSKGRDKGGAEGQGFLSFEAKQHEMGAYMLAVRTSVLRHWKAGLMLKYHGVRRTNAVIECSINPNGLLEYVRIKDPGSSYAFAVICQEAIRKAAPFPKFPFDVPEVYRTENLEITWNFSYL